MYSTKRAGKQGKRANALLIEKVIYNDLNIVQDRLSRYSNF